jgi:hypothetical protein
MVEIKGKHIIDEHNRVLMLRGVNLGGSSKVPATPDGATYRSEGLFQHREVSFVGRPFPLEQADEHYRRLRAWGFNTLRFLITWEAVEHAGPGEFDTKYLDYLRAVVSRAGEHGFMVFIDPHQDVWSRFTGGDGAPGWTLEAAGLDMTKFKHTAAAIVHQTHGDPFPRMIWPTNGYKLAAATMFTLFFAGNDFAPATLMEGIPIQEYLQSHFLEVMRQVALTLSGLDCVIGYDVFNEPQKGYVGVRDLRLDMKTLRIGPTPTPWQSILLASGFPQRVPIFPLGLLGLPLKRHVLTNQQRENAWLPGRTCVWRENGVWDLTSDGTPHLLRPGHFARVGSEPADFGRHHLVPFTRKFADIIHSVDPHALIFMENEVDDSSPTWQEASQHRVVYAPHWYDGITLLTKRFLPALGSHSRKRTPVVGRRNVRRSYAAQLGVLKHEANEDLGGVPVLVGETGIPFDLNSQRAYRTGDFSVQTRAMDRSLRAVETNLLNCTIWNYTSDNDNLHGDLWNDEDLSIYSPDQRIDPTNIHSGGRALGSVVRPYPIATTGQPLHLSFDYHSKLFTYAFKGEKTAYQAPTLIYVPSMHYSGGLRVDVTDGKYTYDHERQILEYYPGTLDSHIITLYPRS